MNEIKFNGYFKDTSLDKINDVLKIYFEKEKPVIKDSLIGEELTITNDIFDIYIYSNNFKENRFLMNGEYNGNISDAVSNIEKLGNLFYSNNILFEIEYFEETLEGEQIGESITIQHPDF
jgi:hypothetical protein